MTSKRRTTGSGTTGAATAGTAKGGAPGAPGSTAESATAVAGEPVSRVDGARKVAGAAPYPNDVTLSGLAHAALVRATVPAGRVTSIDTDAARATPGVLTVLTHTNTPGLARGDQTPLGPQVPPPLADDRVLHYGQYIAVVVAETAEQAGAAADLVRAEYEVTDPVLALDDPRAEVLSEPWGADLRRGDVEVGLAGATLRFAAEYSTPEQTNNPLGLFSTVAQWDGDALTVHDATQHPDNVQAALAGAFGLPPERVRVLAPFVGGGFGAGLRVWQHVILAALAARTVDRPVKLVLTRPQMFTGVGHRPATRQRLRIGTDRTGRLVAIEHEALSSRAMEDGVLTRIANRTGTAYDCPNLVTRDRLVRLNIPCPAHMRAPGTAEANFALESALDEISYELCADPIELRQRNHARTHPQTGARWSSNALLECYEQGAQRFGWAQRDPQPGSMRDGQWLVGYGMAGVTFGRYQPACQARATLRRDGTAYVCSAAIDIGTGTYTVMTQLAADLLGLPMHRVEFALGDSVLPPAPQAGGSGLTMALSSAVHDACGRLIEELLALVRTDVSPLRGCRPQEVTVAGGRMHRIGDPAAGEAYTEILERHGRAEVSADGASAAMDPAGTDPAPAGSFAAKFVEVRIDADLGVLRVARVVSAVDGGRILNPALATSQIIGGTVGGIGMALLEQTVTDPGTGRIANATLGDYLVPVNADVPEIEVIFVGDPDPLTPTGVKGIGEIGLVGIAPAIANAVYHATGRRIRALPITLDQLL